MVTVIVLIDDGYIMNDVARDLENVGLTNVNMLGSILVICGDVDEDKIGALKLVDGVLAVERPRRIKLSVKAG